MGLGVLQNSRSKGRQKFLDAARKGAKKFRGVYRGAKSFGSSVFFESLCKKRTCKTSFSQIRRFARVIKISGAARAPSHKQINDEASLKQEDFYWC